MEFSYHNPIIAIEISLQSEDLPMLVSMDLTKQNQVGSPPFSLGLWNHHACSLEETMGQNLHLSLVLWLHMLLTVKNMLPQGQIYKTLSPLPLLLLSVTKTTSIHAGTTPEIGYL